MAVYKSLCQITSDYTFFSSIYGTFIKTENIETHKASLNKLNIFVIIEVIFFSSQFNCYKWITKSYIFKTCIYMNLKTVLNNLHVKEEITVDI